MQPVTTNTAGSEAAATRVQSPGRWGSSPWSTGGVIPLECRSETVQLVKLAGPVVRPGLSAPSLPLTLTLLKQLLVLVHTGQEIQIT